MNIIDFMWGAAISWVITVLWYKNKEVTKQCEDEIKKIL